MVGVNVAEWRTRRFLLSRYSPRKSARNLQQEAGFAFSAEKATAVATVHWTVAKSRLSNPTSPKIKKFRPSRRMFGIFGGGRWIRTTEVTDNRFTVCPLWPLGNSPIFSSLFAERIGAGRRTRTPDLLITKMRLYVYHAHFVPVLPDTSNLRISFRAINPYSIRALFARWRQGWRQTDFQLVEKSACRGRHVFLAC